jgi:hypothetical protein
MANNHFATHPAADGSYRLYLPNGTFDVNATLPYHQTASANNIMITPADPVHQVDFTLINLPQPANAAFDVDNLTGEVVLSWEPPIDPVLPVMNYRVYKKFNTGPFELIQQTTGLGYTDVISLDGDYAYLIIAVYLNIEGCPSDTLAFEFPYVVENSDENAPQLVTRLNSNYPNPFNPSTTISFDLARPGKARLSVYNVKGQLVKELVDGDMASGQHRVIWNGLDSSGRSVSSGVYFYRLEAGDYVSTRKMLMIK